MSLIKIKFMKCRLLVFFVFVVSQAFSQVSVSSGLYFAKEYSKEKALYNAKDFVMKNVLGVSENVTKFEIDPLAAASSGELTSLVYKCEDKGLNGLILGFYGNRWNDSGVIYQAYGFKNLSEISAKEMLRGLNKVIDENSKYLNSDSDNNNLFYKYEDITFLIYNKVSIIIRVFWKDFDSEWEVKAFNRTRRRFERKMK